MAELALTGLRGSHTLGALAAFGTLRVISRSDLPQPVRMAWIAAPDWQPVLHFPEPVLKSNLISALAAAAAHRMQSPEIAWRDDLKAQPEDFRVFAEQHLAEAAPDQREALDFLAAFGTGTVMQSNGKALKPTPLDMTSASNKFLRDLRKAVQTLSRTKHPAARFQEAVFGPWRNVDDVYAMGWDCEAERVHAYEPIAPTKANHASVIAAIWLAYESLPLFPSAEADRRLATTCFSTRPAVFHWPIWESPLGIDTIRSLLGLADLVQTESSPQTRDRLRRRGVVAVYSALRADLMQGRATFRQPRLV